MAEIYKKYAVKRSTFVDGKLYLPSGGPVDYFPGIEDYKGFVGIGKPTEVKEEDPDEIKAVSPGRWQLPDGTIFSGKKAEAAEAWAKIKEGGGE
jgi:hypothetical protein